MNVRSKGANGEREAAKWWAETFRLEKIPERNLEQVRHGGYDLIGCEPFALEIKRCERLELRKWWVQVANACVKERAMNGREMLPVVMFRRNRRKWEFLISAKEIGIRNGYLRMEDREFILWAKKKMMEESE